MVFQFNKTNLVSFFQRGRRRRVCNTRGREGWNRKIGPRRVIGRGRKGGGKEGKEGREIEEEGTEGKGKGGGGRNGGRDREKRGRKGKEGKGRERKTNIKERQEGLNGGIWELRTIKFNELFTNREIKLLLMENELRADKLLDEIVKPKFNRRERMIRRRPIH